MFDRRRQLVACGADGPTFLTPRPPSPPHQTQGARTPPAALAAPIELLSDLGQHIRQRDSLGHSFFSALAARCRRLRSAADRPEAGRPRPRFNFGTGASIFGTDTGIFGTSCAIFGTVSRNFPFSSDTTSTFERLRGASATGTGGGSSQPSPRSFSVFARPSG